MALLPCVACLPPAAAAQVLTKHGIVSDEVSAKVKEFIIANQTAKPSAGIAAAAAAEPKPAEKKK